jgi:hypothetical protein
MKILLGDLNAKLGRADIFKKISGNESLHEISHYNGVRVLKITTLKYVIVKSTMFPHRNIHEYTFPNIIMVNKSRRMGQVDN